MATGEEAQRASEADIAVHWREEGYVWPPASFAAQANLQDRSVYDRMSLERFPDYFAEHAELLDWFSPYEAILDTSHAPEWRWFTGGSLNAAYNCLDRHLEGARNRVAFHFVPEPEDEPVVSVSYQQLWRRVNAFAALLRDYAGVQKGDRVTIHMPMTVELPVAMLACARLGAVHSVVFGGFSAQACADRMVDSQSHVLVTMDAYYRGGRLIDHKAKADETVALAREQGLEVRHVLVWQRHRGRYQSAAPLVPGRDALVEDLLASSFARSRVAPEPMRGEDPLFLMYTSGSTGKPKAIRHGTAGYLAWVAWTSRYIQDLRPDDVYWCMADIGWITGHSYIVYGPLALGVTGVIYEGVPTHPDAGRPWRVAEALGVSVFHTSPTAIRQLRRDGPDEPQKYDHRFRIMTTVGEPIEPDVWRWYHGAVGKGQAVVVDTWWQTETGGWLITQAPGLMPMKPGSAGPALPGIHPVILDEEGREVPAGSGRAGNLCLRAPWPGIAQGIWGDRERFIATYFAKYNRDPESKDWRDWPYMAGDGAMQAADGYYRILGRIDDVINVAGHRLGTKELESAALKVEGVAEAAVVAALDSVKGRVPEVFVSLEPGFDGSGVAAAVRDAVTREIGPIARPRAVWVVPDLPKTRSGKIMRRILAAIANGREDVGDVTSLANPEAVDAIRALVQGGAAGGA
ncbi:MAG: acetate--CoA ligase [Firmicutes bacterium]|nr:acetate--CoA ligase [Bacillota bacterium]